MDLVSTSGEHQPSSSAHGARGSPEPPWPYGEPMARGELGKRRDPEPRRIGAKVFPEYSFPLQNAAPGIAIGVNSEIVPWCGPP